MKGLPASGKSTFAKELIKKDHTYKRVNRVDLRSMIDAGQWSTENEKFIRRVRNVLIRTALQRGFNVVLDDTNLRSDIFTEVCDLVEALNITATVYEKYFDTPADVCIERDKARTVGHVGEKVILDNYTRYVKNNPGISSERRVLFVHRPTPYTQQNKSLPKAILCDLDGTLALIGRRDPYNATHAEQDEVNEPVADVLDLYSLFGETQIIFVSGREDKYREATEAFLKKAKEEHGYDFGNYQLFMRQTGDSRKDSIIKKEIFDAQIKDQYYVQFVLDDRDQVVHLWRNLGLPTFQVNYGDF
jgi:predicted kinase